jgi:quercetin dioxygenase-like cupin family protein
MQTDKLLMGWDIRRTDEAEWLPWGEGDKARSQILGQADGYTVTLIEAEAGYVGSAHEHTYAEFFYLIEGQIRNQGQVINQGDGYAASAGSVHSDFEVLAPAKYVIIWRI